MGEPAIGATLGGYRIDALIARGGMGVVYRATHIALDRPVALKVIARELAGKEGFRERFLRESRLAARLDHPAVVPILDAREEDGELIVAMRLVEGGDLRKLIDSEGALPAPQAIELLAQVAGALDSAHAAGIVHRDVKPHNILVERDRAFLTDFGLAKALEDSGVLSDASVVGTLEYMSPEQWQGRRVGPATDVYSLGCVLYEALTGIAPYARKASDTEPEIPEGLDAVIERAVAKEPADRYPSAGALIEAAGEHQGGPPAKTQVLSERPDKPTLALPGGGAGAGAAPRRPFGEPGGRTSRHPAALLDRLPAWPWRWIVAAAVAAVAVVVALVLLLSGGDDVSVSAPIEVGHGPLRVAAGEGSVWVTSATDGTLIRIDPRAETVVGQPIRLRAGVSGVATGEGAVWVSSPRAGQVLRIDPESGRVTERVEVGGRPGAIVVGGNRVWVADEDGSGVTAINAEGGKVFKRGIPPPETPLRLAVGAAGLWVSSASTGAVRRIDLGDATAGGAIPVGRGPAGITVGGGSIWVANTRADTVSLVSPATHSLLGEPIPVGEGPGGIDAGTDTVWVANFREGTVSRISIDDAETIGDPIDVGPRPGAVAVGEEAVWVANNGDGTITRIEP